MAGTPARKAGRFGSAGTIHQNITLWPFQHGSPRILRPLVAAEGTQRGPYWTAVEAADLLRLGPEPA